MLPGRRLHAERPPVNVEQRLLLLDLGGFLFADADKLADHLHVEAGTLRLRVDVLDVVRQRLALLLEPLDALDQAIRAASPAASRLPFAFSPLPIAVTAMRASFCS